MKVNVEHIFDGYAVNFVAGATAIDLGEMVKLSSSTIVPVAAEGDQSTFVGISDGQALTTVDAGKQIVVYTKCICRVSLTSAAYNFGDGLKWADDSTLVAADANTIGWFWDATKTGQTLTEGLVLFDITQMGSVTGNLIDIALA